MSMKILATDFSSRLPNFQSWGKKQGFQFFPTTSEWEIIRFHDRDGALGIVCRNSRNSFVTCDGIVTAAWQDFMAGAAYSGTPPRCRPNAKRMRNLREAVADRDGNDLCIYCGQPGATSLEHLLDRKWGGTDHIANLALAHSECNSLAAKADCLADKIRWIKENKYGPNNS